MSDNLIKFPKLVDSSVETSIITVNENMTNSKDRNIKINLSLLNENNKIENLKMFIDLSNFTNLNYKLKSACNQIEDSIKNLANK
jgi:hypothetical protein